MNSLLTLSFPNWGSWGLKTEEICGLLQDNLDFLIGNLTFFAFDKEEAFYSYYLPFFSPIPYVSGYVFTLSHIIISSSGLRVGCYCYSLTQMKKPGLRLTYLPELTKLTSGRARVLCRGLSDFKTHALCSAWTLSLTVLCHPGDLIELWEHSLEGEEGFTLLSLQGLFPRQRCLLRLYLASFLAYLLTQPASLFSVTLLPLLFSLASCL